MDRKLTSVLVLLIALAACFDVALARFPRGAGGGGGGSAPVNTVAPVIAGTGGVGNVATVSSTGTWTGVPTPSLTCQWWQDSSTTMIAGATSCVSYTQQSSDAGHTINLVVTGSNIHGAATAASNNITVPSSGVPTVAGGATMTMLDVQTSTPYSAWAPLTDADAQTPNAGKNPVCRWLTEPYQVLSGTATISADCWSPASLNRYSIGSGQATIPQDTGMSTATFYLDNGTGASETVDAFGAWPTASGQEHPPVNGAIIYGTITSAGTGGTNGTYNGVAFSGGTGTGATGVVVIAGNVASAVYFPGGEGSGYSKNDVLSATVGGLTVQWTVKTVGAQSQASGYIDTTTLYDGLHQLRGVFADSAGTKRVLQDFRNVVSYTAPSAGSLVATIPASSYIGGYQYVTPVSSNCAALVPGTAYQVTDNSRYGILPLGTGVVGVTTAGSGYTDGTYTNVPLLATASPLNPSGGLATIVVSGGAVASINVTRGSASSLSPGNYTIGDVITVAGTQLGGTGSGFTGSVLNASNPQNSADYLSLTGVIAPFTSCPGGSGGIVLRNNGPMPYGGVETSSSVYSPSNNGGGSLWFWTNHNGSMTFFHDKLDLAGGTDSSDCSVTACKHFSQVLTNRNFLGASGHSVTYSGTTISYGGALPTGIVNGIPLISNTTSGNFDAGVEYWVKNVNTGANTFELWNSPDSNGSAVGGGSGSLTLLNDFGGSDVCLTGTVASPQGYYVGTDYITPNTPTRIYAAGRNYVIHPCAGSDGVRETISGTFPYGNPGVAVTGAGSGIGIDFVQVDDVCVAGTASNKRCLDASQGYMEVASLLNNTTGTYQASIWGSSLLWVNPGYNAGIYFGITNDLNFGFGTNWMGGQFVTKNTALYTYWGLSAQSAMLENKIFGPQYRGWSENSAFVYNTELVNGEPLGQGYGSFTSLTSIASGTFSPLIPTSTAPNPAMQTYAHSVTSGPINPGGKTHPTWGSSANWALAPPSANNPTTCSVEQGVCIQECYDASGVAPNCPTSSDPDGGLMPSRYTNSGITGGTPGSYDVTLSCVSCASGGSGGVVTVVINNTGGLASTYVLSYGLNYTIGDVLTGTAGGKSFNLTLLNVSHNIVGGIAGLGSITTGSGGTNGIYENIALSGGTGSGATAQVIVSGGVVTQVLLASSTGTLYGYGHGYTVSDTLSGTAGGVSFSVPVTYVCGAGTSCYLMDNWSTTTALVANSTVAHAYDPGHGDLQHFFGGGWSNFIADGGGDWIGNMFWLLGGAPHTSGYVAVSDWAVINTHTDSYGPNGATVYTPELGGCGLAGRAVLNAFFKDSTFGNALWITSNPSGEVCQMNAVNFDSVNVYQQWNTSLVTANSDFSWYNSAVASTWGYRTTWASQSCYGSGGSTTPSTSHCSCVGAYGYCN